MAIFQRFLRHDTFDFVQISKTLDIRFCLFIILWHDKGKKLAKEGILFFLASFLGRRRVLFCGYFGGHFQLVFVESGDLLEGLLLGDVLKDC